MHKYKVFISAVQKDIRAERRRVEDLLSAMFCFRSQVGWVNRSEPIDAFFVGCASPLDKLRTGFTQPYF